MNQGWRWLNAASTLVLALPAHAADWYVDAVNGSNGNSGMAPSQAWRTITHAVATVPAGPQRVLVAAGTYNEALGETFPIRMRDQLQLLGAGAASTQIINTAPPTFGQFEGQGGIVNCRVVWEASGPNIGPGTLLAGFRITSTRGPHAFPNPPQGVWLEARYGTCEAELRDLTLDSMQCGIRVEAQNQFARANASRVKLLSNLYGLTVTDSGQCIGSEIEAVDSGNDGVNIYGRSGASIVSLSRSRIEGSQFYGVYAEATSNPFVVNGDVTLDLRDCLLIHNSVTTFGAVAVSLTADAFSPLNAHIERCSVFDNWRGVDAWGPCTTTIDSCLLQNIGDDLSYSTAPAVAYSNISDGDFLGLNGNISAPALLVAPATGDYRLRFDSPGIDAGNPATAAGTLDFQGIVRSIDGNLDTLERADIGAFEFAPLFRQGSGRIGSRLKLECWGPIGASATIFFSRKPLASTPQSTPFGEFDLDPLHFSIFGTSAAGQSAPVIFNSPVLNNPVLIGQTFSFQARTTSPLAPNGAAYTNGVQFTVLP